MSIENTSRVLLPIGSRVSHFKNGGHGHGTILAYNGVAPNRYLQENFGEAVKMAGAAGLLDGVINSMYSNARYPYVVRWDVRTWEVHSDFDKEMRRKYPRGYKDVYGDECLPINNGENIFTDDTVAIMGRQWLEEERKWSDWKPVPEEQYLEIEASTLRSDWDFCVRPLPSTS